MMTPIHKLKHNWDHSREQEYNEHRHQTGILFNKPHDPICWCCHKHIESHLNGGKTNGIWICHPCRQQIASTSKASKPYHGKVKQPYAHRKLFNQHIADADRSPIRVRIELHDKPTIKNPKPKPHTIITAGCTHEAIPISPNAKSATKIKQARNY